MRYLSPERIARRYAFVSNPIVTLAAYLSKDDYGKALEILTSYPEEFSGWLEENRPWLMEHGYPEFARIDLQLAIERGEWNASTTEVPKEVVLKFWGDIEETSADTQKLNTRLGCLCATPRSSRMSG
jgi:hypothetical protein